MGAVWEVNHVWLIFALVVLWTGFSSAFESIFSTLFIPLSLAALGVVLRGSGFAFHRTAARSRGRVAAEGLFGTASLLTPFFMGTVLGAIAGGRVPVGNAGAADVERYFTTRALASAIITGILAGLALLPLHSDAR
jgi:cytochrome bd ubiquinol oxidase subunit II